MLVSVTFQHLPKDEVPDMGLSCELMFLGVPSNGDLNIVTMARM